MAALKSAVVGLGNVGKSTHVPVLESLDAAELIAVCDMNESRLREVTREYDVAGFTSVEEMIQGMDVDSIHICTPPQTHAPVAKTVLAEGIPVLIEKPVTHELAALDEIIEVAEANAVPASVVHNQLFFESTQEALSRVNHGEIGDVCSVTMLFSEPRDVRETPRGDWVFELPGGEIGEGLAHQVYLPLAFVDGLGSIDCIAKQQYHEYNNEGQFDGLTINATDSSGHRSITIKISTDSAYQNELIVQGTDGMLRLDLLKRKGFREYTSSTTGTSHARMFLTSSIGTISQNFVNLIEQAADQVIREINSRVNDDRDLSHLNHYWLVRNYINAIRTGGEVPVTLEESRDTIQILEAIK